MPGDYLNSKKSAEKVGREGRPARFKAGTAM